MDAAFDPSYEAWEVGLELLPAAAVVAPAAPAVIDSSYLLFNAAAMLAQAHAHEASQSLRAHCEVATRNTAAVLEHGEVPSHSQITRIDALLVHARSCTLYTKHRNRRNLSRKHIGITR